MQIFLQFSVFQCEASGQSLLASGRVKLSRPDGSDFVRMRSAPNGRTIRILVRTRGTYPLVSNAARPNDINTPSRRRPHRPYI